jgi:hypothetical protein
MPFSYLPPWLTTPFTSLAHWLDRRSALRLPVLLAGTLFATGRRTVTSWFRACGIQDEFRPAYTTACACGRRAALLARSVVHAVRPALSASRRLTVAIDDTPTARWGPEAEGCGTHHNPSKGPAGEKYVYGHVWAMLAALARHPDWGTIALPLLADLSLRCGDVDKLPPQRKRPFRTRLELAASATLPASAVGRAPLRAVVGRRRRRLRQEAVGAAGRRGRPGGEKPAAQGRRA